MRIRWSIGNDIVDLAEPGVAGKENDRRFMERVFTPAEREHILQAAVPTIALWKTWAAKETAFKIASKLRGRVVFAHRAFEVEHVSPGRPSWVRFEGLDIGLRWETAVDYVHCIGHCALARAGDSSGCRVASDIGAQWRRVFSGIAREGQQLDGELSFAEQASVHSTASERARLLARRLVERWGLQGAEIVRLWQSWRLSPPLVASGGTPLSAFDVSLSHDGRFVAAAIIGPGASSWSR